MDDPPSATVTLAGMLDGIMILYQKASREI